MNQDMKLNQDVYMNQDVKGFMHMNQDVNMKSGT